MLLIPYPSFKGFGFWSAETKERLLGHHQKYLDAL